MATDTTETAAAAETAAETGGKATESVGMPQLDFTTFPNQIFWLVITLIAIYLILTRIAMPRIESVLSERAGTITNDIAAAEELKSKAQEAEAAYEQALADARVEANRIVVEAKAEIQADLDVELQKADAKIAAQTAKSEIAIQEIRDSALDNIKEVARDTAKALVAALGGKSDAKSVSAAVTSRMKG